MFDCQHFSFQFVFDNYSEAHRPSSASPAASHSKRTPGDVSLNDSPSADFIQQELTELRQQLQAMKKTSHH
jgi:hypothetical protein